MELRFVPEIGMKNPAVSTGSVPIRKLEGLVTYQPREMAVLEVEPTTNCNLACPSCPRTVWSSCWIGSEMSMEHFDRAASIFDRFETIHFRGWGEPLIHPHFPEMIRRAYQSGARIALTTNGQKPLDQGLLPYLTAVIYRLEHGSARSYELRNPEASFGRAIFNVSRTLYHRDRAGADYPRVVLMFTKNKYTLHELPSYLETAARLQPDRVVFRRPRFHARPIDDKGALPADIDPGLMEKVEERLATLARRYGLDMINEPPDEAEDEADCSCIFDPAGSLFLDWAGRVHICRHGALPLANNYAVRHFHGRIMEVKTTSLGNLMEAELDSVLDDGAYRLVRQGCLSGQWCRAGHELPADVDSDSADGDYRKNKVIYIGRGT